VSVSRLIGEDILTCLPLKMTINRDWHSKSATSKNKLIEAALFRCLHLYHIKINYSLVSSYEVGWRRIFD